MINKIFALVFEFFEKASISQKEKKYRNTFHICESARLGYLPHIVFKGNIEIGAYSYFNSGQIITGRNSYVKIGEWCAIGYNVNIHAITHDPYKATGPENERPAIESSVVIGNHCWIGSNVFILPGVIVGDNSIIGANAVVTKNVPANSIVGGVPAKLIKFKQVTDGQ